MSEKKVEMNSTVNWQDEIAVIAGQFDGNRKGWLARAARKADTTYRQVKALYYGESQNPRHSVAVKILSAADQARIEAARREGEKVASAYISTATALQNIDPDFHRASIDALVNAARILDSLDRS